MVVSAAVSTLTAKPPHMDTAASPAATMHGALGGGDGFDLLDLSDLPSIPSDDDDDEEEEDMEMEAYAGYQASPGAAEAADARLMLAASDVAAPSAAAAAAAMARISSGLSDVGVDLLSSAAASSRASSPLSDLDVSVASMDDDEDMMARAAVTSMDDDDSDEDDGYRRRRNLRSPTGRGAGSNGLAASVPMSAHRRPTLIGAAPSIIDADPRRLSGGGEAASQSAMPTSHASHHRRSIIPSGISSPRDNGQDDQDALLGDMPFQNILLDAAAIAERQAASDDDMEEEDVVKKVRKKGRRGGRIARNNLRGDAGATLAEEADDDAEADDDDSRKRTREMRASLEKLEAAYAQLKEKAFHEKSMQLDREIRCIRSGMHPAVALLMQQIDEKRNHLLRVAEQRHVLEQRAAQHEVNGRRRAAHQQYATGIKACRRGMLESVLGELRHSEREYRRTRAREAYRKMCAQAQALMQQVSATGEKADTIVDGGEQAVAEALSPQPLPDPAEAEERRRLDAQFASIAW